MGTPINCFLDEELISNACSLYGKLKSVKKVASEFGLSIEKTRKILITGGLYNTKKSRKVAKFHAEGLSNEKIGRKLKMQPKVVSSYLPYEKTMYNLAVKSDNAKRCELYQKRSKTARKQMHELWATLESSSVPATQRREEPLWWRTRSLTWTPVKLRLSLSDERFTTANGYSPSQLHDIRYVLKRYGGSPDGHILTRDIIVPSDITLHYLHYVIQRAFGWQGRHRHKYFFSDEDFMRIVQGTATGWAALVGCLFECDQNFYDRNCLGDNDFGSGSIRSWQRKKYTGPYVSGEWVASPLACRRMFEQQHVADRFSEKIQKPFNDCTAAELLRVSGTDVNVLMENLRLENLLAKGNDLLTTTLSFKKGPRPITRTLYYMYDFTDRWTVKVSRPLDCGKGVNGKWRQTAENILAKQHRAVCLTKHGRVVIDDIGGLEGFTTFLARLKVYGNKPVNSKELIDQAISKGWRIREPSARKLL
ncbi:MAG: plasmid pRiA4b ORF-3 family protein [Spirochaetia bacterium]|jgi:hypothetical protein|nr:plasmid pRiA4b ORF-3 family protein [Spirochaetia bacterium]